MLTFNKKVLIISSWAPPGLGASPHFLFNLLSNFDKDSFILYTDKNNADPTLKGQKLLCKYFFFENRNNNLNNKSKVRRITTRAINFFLTIKNGLEIIKNEQIEVLLGTADKGWALFSTFALSKISKKPYAVYLLDLYRWNNFGLLGDILASLFEPILFRNAKKIFVMGEGHRKFYEKKYGAKYTYEIITNCPQVYSGQNIKKHNPSTPYKILYTGNIYWPQEKSIRNLIEAVSQMDDLNVCVSLYTPKLMKVFQAEYSKNPKVEFHSATQKEMANIQANADILFIPLSWGTPRIGVIEMAIPGKTAEYLISGRPILVYAPPYAFLAEYADKYQFARVVDKEEIGFLKEGIRDILTNPHYSETLACNAKALFKKEYDLLTNAQKLKQYVDKI